VAVWQGRRVYGFTRPGDAAAQAFAKSLGARWAGGSDETPPEENLEYAQFDPQQLDQLMSEGLSDEDLPSMSLPRKSPAVETAADADADIAEEAGVKRGGE